MKYTGPCNIDCLEQCDVPAGVTLADVPTPRHAWGDVTLCPNTGCDRAFQILEVPDQGESLPTHAQHLNGPESAS